MYYFTNVRSRLSASYGAGATSASTPDDMANGIVVAGVDDITLANTSNNNHHSHQGNNFDGDRKISQPAQLQQQQQAQHAGAQPREKWANKAEFLLAVIGFSVDLGNVWRFPYICYRNGGGAFLIPYFVMFIFGGLPLFYMELALGQYKRAGCLSIWNKVCPIFKGIGFAICFIATYMAFFYNTIISWAVYFMIRSFEKELPWKKCNPAWSTNSCSLALSGLDTENITMPNVTMHNVTALNNASYKPVSPAEEFFVREVLQMHKSNGIHDLGDVRWELALCLLAVYFVVYFALWKGPRSSGKAVWITATCPYIVLLVLLVHGAMLPGAADGVYYYLNPQWDRLNQTQVWIDAATQVFFSLGPGFGVLLALSSYNEFDNNCYRDALLTSLINCVTSLLSGFVIFCTLGYMAKKLQTDVASVAGEGGPGLVFIVYPQAIATMQWSSFWAVIFFFMIITLGIDSTFAGLEAMITAFCDEYPRTLGQHRELFVLAVIVYCYMGSLPTTTYGGNYLVEFLDHYGVSFSILFVVVVETIAVCWFYGVKRFSNDVQEMLGFQPGLPWKICWIFISPVFILIIFICACVDLKPLVIMGYVYPPWAVWLGWVIRSSSLLCIPVYMIYKLSVLKGTFFQRLLQAVTPQETERRLSNQYCLVSPPPYPVVEAPPPAYTEGPTDL